MTDISECQLLKARGKCREPRDMTYVVDDVVLVICHEHIKLEPGELDAICRRTIVELKKEEKKEAAAEARKLKTKEEARESKRSKRPDPGRAQEAEAPLPASQVQDGVLPGFGEGQ